MRFPGGGMTVLSVFLLVPLGIFLVSGAARAEEESSSLSRAGAWLGRTGGTGGRSANQTGIAYA